MVVVGTIVAFILRLYKETRFCVKDVIFRDKLCSKQFSSIYLAIKISLVLKRLLGL